MENNEYNLDDTPDFSSNGKGENPFDLPLNYFSSFEDKLKKRLAEEENELKDFPVLASIPKTNLFTVPGAYFTEMANSLEHQTELAAYPQLQAIAKPVMYDLDENYVTAFQASLNHRINLADELKLYKTLHVLDKINVFDVPEQYFESVTERIKDRVHADTTIRPSIIETLLDFIFGKKMALAFGLVFIIGLSVYFNGLDTTSEQPQDCKTLACLEKQDILNSNKAISGFDDEQLIDLVDVNALDKQLNLKENKPDSSQVNDILLENSGTDDLLDEL